MDSVTLFNILLELKKKKSICLSLFHVNYNMHSKSDLMHKYCVQLAQDNNIQIFTRNFNYKLFNNSNIESKARDYRYNEIKNICLESKIKYEFSITIIFSKEVIAILFNVSFWKRKANKKESRSEQRGITRVEIRKKS